MKLRFAWIDKHTFGNVFLNTGEITINRELLIAETLKHELIHLEHPDWSEDRVIRETYKRIHRMTVKQIKALARKAERLGKK